MSYAYSLIRSDISSYIYIYTVYMNRWLSLACSPWCFPVPLLPLLYLLVCEATNKIWTWALCNFAPWRTVERIYLFFLHENRCFQRHEPVDTDEPWCGVNVAFALCKRSCKRWSEMLLLESIPETALRVAGSSTVTLRGRQSHSRFVSNLQWAFGNWHWCIETNGWHNRELYPAVGHWPFLQDIWVAPFFSFSFFFL